MGGKEGSKSKVSAGLGLAWVVLLFILQQYGKNSPAMVVLLVALMVSFFIYAALHTNWIQACDSRRSKICRGVIAVLLIIVVGVGVAAWIWPQSIYGEIRQIAMFDAFYSGEDFSAAHATPESREAKSRGAVALLLVAVKNAGSTPTIVEEYRLSISAQSLKIEEASPVIIRRRWVAGSRRTDKPLMVLLPEMLLFNKTLKPVGPGEIVCGWLLFSFPQATSEQLARDTTRWDLSFGDVAGDRHHVTGTTRFSAKELPKHVPCSEPAISDEALKGHYEAETSPQ